MARCLHMSVVMKTIDTMNRNRSNVHIALVQDVDGYYLRGNIGAAKQNVGPLSRDEAADIWERLQTVGTPSWHG